MLFAYIPQISKILIKTGNLGVCTQITQKIITIRVFTIFLEFLNLIIVISIRDRGNTF